MKNEEPRIEGENDGAVAGTQEGWFDTNGHFFWGENAERNARYYSATHRRCSCGLVLKKSRIYCPPCEQAKDLADWHALESAEFDFPLCIFRDDVYFYGEDDLVHYIEEHEVKRGDLLLVPCKAPGFSIVDEDLWADQLPEDGELPDGIKDALKRLNAEIRHHNEFGTPVSYYGDDKRKVVIPESVWKDAGVE